MKSFMDRRTFLQTLCILSAGKAVEGFAAPLNTISFSSSLVQVSETRNLMGTFVTITLLHPSRDQAQTVLGTAFHKMENWIQLFNRHESGTPLDYLNERGFIQGPPPELVKVLRQSLMIHSRTGGLFDVTVKPLLDLYETENRLGRLPSVPSIQEALNRVGASGLKIEPKKISFCKEGMGITLDGIAKGTIVDKIIHFIREKGIRHALVAAGGDIKVFGGGRAGVPWKISVYDPHDETDFGEMILLNEGAVSTSGNYMVYFDQEKVHHHILSPDTGVSPLRSVSASVIAPSAEEADALATSLMLLGSEEGQSLINQDRRLAALWITLEGEKIKSLRWKRIMERRERGKDYA